MSLLKKLFTSFKKIFKKNKKKKRKSSFKRRKPLRKKKSTLRAIKKRTQRPSAPKIIKKIVKISKPVLKASAAPGLLIGEVTHYFTRIAVVVIKITAGNLHVGDKIQIRGKSTDFVQPVKSLQIESVNVKSARKGQLAGLKVDKEAKAGDKVYKL